ncbi:helix-turn-helix transcriptional regulator [Pseudomonas sp. N040]|uniref:helix-turn-helix transcriptional regulator n=1 Tax=Pseudomonas sp. N040 TaxID=2785325 RepID=UPI0018A2EC52|nr:AraC family transcriptional regulator [Pseudomonas sp. N040]MBF7729086.1 AraC family transcriptional regulator ligand-binding domain-containing protein [Pseudomonas sp. N040]MBW7012726.1 AraC family transcriptional regulator [Pseudomonas sp. N040]
MFLVRTGSIEGYEKLVSQLGQNPPQLLRKAGFSPAQLHQPNTYVSYSKLASLLDSSAVLCDEPLFGLRLAAGQNLMVVGELALPVSHQPTLSAALSYYDQHAHLHSRGVHVHQLVRGELAEVSLSFDFSNASGLLQLKQLSVCQLFNGMRVMLENAGQQLKFHLRQSRPSQGNWHWDVPAGQLLFDSHLDGVSFPASWLARSPRKLEALVTDHLEQRIQFLESRYPNNLQAQVCHLISNLLPHGECTVGSVAAALSLHPRVLQKRLQAVGSSFAGLLRDTRLEIAQQHLRHSRLSITELALNLGYAEVAVFSRNFKAWTGESPLQWRQRQRTEG